jgi:CelD/BcsL family acetyltransferase involved in cellulose biosynthesis
MTAVGQDSVSVGSALLGLDDPRWTRFAAAHPAATAFHLPAWSVAIAQCYRFRAFALAALSPGGEVVAGMPIVAVPRPWAGPHAAKWVTLPFTDHCPPLSAAGVDESSWLPLVRAAALAAGVRRIQVRAAVAGGAQTAVAVRHLLPLTGDPDVVYRQFHRSQVQRNIRRAEREGVVVRAAERPTDLTETFYRLHLHTRRRQGVPVQPRRLFELIWRHVIAPGHGTVLVASHEDRPIAAAVFLRHNGTVIYKYGASDSSAWSLRPNHALFWHAIRTACEAGDTVLDWGRTDFENEGLRAFKSAWGAVEQPLHYTTLGGADAGSDLGASRAAGVLGATIRRSPTWVCTAVGEALYRFTA